MSLSGPLRFLLSSIFPPSPPPQGPLGPIGEQPGFAGTGEMNEGADEEEGGDDDPEGEGDPVAWLAHRVDSKTTGDPAMALLVGG